MHWTSRPESPGVINLEHNFRAYGMVIAFGPDEGSGWRAWVSRELVPDMELEKAPLFASEREAKLALLRMVNTLLVERAYRTTMDIGQLKMEFGNDG
jgi:hypothetical protein